MSHFQTYYANIHKQKQALVALFPDGACLVVSKGCICEAPLDIAARLLVEGTHALASESQIQKFHEAQRMNRPPISGLDAARAAFAKLILKEGPQ